MNRRDLLQRLAWSLPAGALLPHLLSSCKKSPDLFPGKKFEGTVAIIGAGAAGLYAGYLLREKGAKVTIYEASGSIGGRMNSVSNLSDFALETGATELYGKRSLYTDFLDTIGGKPAEHPSLPPFSNELSAAVKALPRQILTDRSLVSVLLDRFAGIENSVKFLSKVTGIAHDGDTVMLTLADGTKAGYDKVVVTVPAAVLKSGAVSFSPALPADKTEALSALTPLPALRIIWRFSSNFWGNDYAIAGAGDFERFEAPGSIRGSENLVLTGTVYGAKALEYSQLYNNGNGENIAYTKMINILDEVYGDAKATNATKPQGTVQPTFIVKDWIGDTNFGGAYCYSEQGANRAALAAPVGAKLFFAGEATATNDMYGTIQGALESALIAVNQIYETIS